VLDFDMGESAAELRSRLRGLVHEHLPADYLGAFTHDPADLEVAQRFCKTLAAEHLLALAWPTEYGGGGGSIWEQTVVREEMWAFHEPRGAQYMGINWVGPVIMRHGTAEQKAQHLPPIAGGDVIWCQGFSEPNAGSDLASLRTAAVRDGSAWRITGQKIWTSYAQMAQWIFLLARTSKGEAKQQGITIFLLPVDRDGIEVRPIPSMLGAHHLNEVFLDDVAADDSEILGPVHDGWRLVLEALAFERVGIARYARTERLLQAARNELADEWDEVPQALKVRYSRALVNARRARLLAYRVIHQQERVWLLVVEG
jgi:alkylation response protein AidB-like acyl-CoA dehydrogenase